MYTSHRITEALVFEDLIRDPVTWALLRLREQLRPVPRSPTDSAVAATASDTIANEASHTDDIDTPMAPPESLVSPIEASPTTTMADVPNFTDLLATSTPAKKVVAAKCPKIPAKRSSDPRVRRANRLAQSRRSISPFVVPNTSPVSPGSDYLSEMDDSSDSDAHLFVNFVDEYRKRKAMEEAARQAAELRKSCESVYSIFHPGS